MEEEEFPELAALGSPYVDEEAQETERKTSRTVSVSPPAKKRRSAGCVCSGCGINSHSGICPVAGVGPPAWGQKTRNTRTKETTPYGNFCAMCTGTYLINWRHLFDRLMQKVLRELLERFDAYLRSNPDEHVEFKQQTLKYIDLRKGKKSPFRQETLQSTVISSEFIQDPVEVFVEKDVFRTQIADYTKFGNIKPIEFTNCFGKKLYGFRMTWKHEYEGIPGFYKLVRQAGTELRRAWFIGEPDKILAATQQTKRFLHETSKSHTSLQMELRSADDYKLLELGGGQVPKEEQEAAASEPASEVPSMGSDIGEFAMQTAEGPKKKQKKKKLLREGPRAQDAGAAEPEQYLGDPSADFARCVGAILTKFTEGAYTALNARQANQLRVKGWKAEIDMYNLLEAPSTEATSAKQQLDTLHEFVKANSKTKDLKGGAGNVVQLKAAFTRLLQADIIMPACHIRQFMDATLKQELQAANGNISIAAQTFIRSPSGVKALSEASSIDEAEVTYMTCVSALALVFFGAAKRLPQAELMRFVLSEMKMLQDALKIVAGEIVSQKADREISAIRVVPQVGMGNKPAAVPSPAAISRSLLPARPCHAPSPEPIPLNIRDPQNN